MDYENVLLDKQDHIAIITLNRPDNLNTFNIPITFLWQENLIKL